MSSSTLDRPINIVFLGAGSMFCPNLCRDILQIPGADRGQFRLCDLNPDRLTTMHQVVAKMIRETGREAGWTVCSNTDRREILPGADYAICCVEVSGTSCVDFDNDIPLKYGIDQCIGDTLGPGGLFKGMRTVPVFLDILRDLAELAPNAFVLNYTNPMSLLILSAGRVFPQLRIVGLCHSVQDTSHRLADYAGVPYDQMKWECAGINHLAWFTKLKHQGRDLYQTVLYEKFAREIEQGIKEADAGLASHDSRDDKNIAWQQTDLVRKDMCLHFGAFITESSGHLSEYLPYYRKSDAGRKLLRTRYDGGSRFYATNWPNWRKKADEMRHRLTTGEEPIKLERSWEYASYIIEACEKDSPLRIHGNVMNHVAGAGQLITNLPADGCVEVACMIDRNGVHPTRFGKLPPQMAHICASNMAFFDLASTACIEKSRQAAIHALMLDPLTQAVLTPGQIKQMTLEMFEAEGEFLPGFT
ncbi:MAG TPA: alpha-glucosidase/alpha-galactosidase [Tepidisphaeraceae bacterium]|nr:alpha-glucosidase/alpha-galactosidase [Tepidisphaeraceae bacterium]